MGEMSEGVISWYRQMGNDRLRHTCLEHFTWYPYDLPINALTGSIKYQQEDKQYDEIGRFIELRLLFKACGYN